MRSLFLAMGLLFGSLYYSISYAANTRQASAKSPNQPQIMHYAAYGDRRGAQRSRGYQSQVRGQRHRMHGPRTYKPRAYKPQAYRPRPYKPPRQIQRSWITAPSGVYHNRGNLRRGHATYRYGSPGHRTNRQHIQRYRSHHESFHQRKIYRNRYRYPYYGGHRYRGRYWVTVPYGYIPLGAYILYYRGGDPVYACMVSYKGKYYFGTVLEGRPCYIKYNGHRIAFEKYQVMTN